MGTRRKFLSDCGKLAGSAGFSYFSSNTGNWTESEKNSGKKSAMTLQFKPYELHLKHVFTLASGSRSTTPRHADRDSGYDDIVGYGEASMPPYLGREVESVRQFS